MNSHNFNHSPTFISILKMFILSENNVIESRVKLYSQAKLNISVLIQFELTVIEMLNFKEVQYFYADIYIISVFKVNFIFFPLVFKILEFVLI